MQTATPSEDDPSEGTRPLPLRDALQQRRKAVLGTAAGVVSMLALGGVITLARSFAPDEPGGCATSCAADRSTAPGVAEPRATPSRTATGTPSPTGGEPGRTFAPTVVRQEKQAKPRVTAPPDPPSVTTEPARPPWHGRWPWRHGHGPW